MKTKLTLLFFVSLLFTTQTVLAIGPTTYYLQTTDCAKNGTWSTTKDANKTLTQKAVVTEKSMGTEVVLEYLACSGDFVLTETYLYGQGLNFPVMNFERSLGTTQTSYGPSGIKVVWKKSFDATGKEIKSYQLFINPENSKFITEGTDKISFFNPPTPFYKNKTDLPFFKSKK